MDDVRMPEMSKPITLALRIIEHTLAEGRRAVEDDASSVAFVIMAALKDAGLTLADARPSPPIPEGWRAFTEPHPCIIHNETGMTLNRDTLSANLYGTDPDLDVSPALRWLLAQVTS